MAPEPIVPARGTQGRKRKFDRSMNTKNFDNPDDALAAASKLDSRGDWTASLDLYRHAAERWPEHKEYIQRCIDRVTEKQASTQTLQNSSCPPSEHMRNETRSLSRRGGCGLVFVLSVAGMLIWTTWSIFEPARRAERVHQAIRPGASFQEVESLLTGRYFCFYQVKTNEEWQSLSRSEFIDAVETKSTNASPAMRLQLTFLGLSPYRVSFDVELDCTGNVTNVTKPYGWD